ncbi:MAG TPA: permease-like cell division protein FtsX [Actinomycetota bacterium]|jgi:cell division transport system permease protein|nr:permease-like cell division protein FtsX [Actinomycetota bacterium]
MGRRFGYFFRETLTAVRRNALVTFAAISTVFISLFLLGGSLLVERQVRLMAGEWASKVEVSVFIRDAASTDQITALGNKISDMPEVERVFFESREEAYGRFKKLFADSTALIENVDADAMPQSYRVKLKDPEKFAVIRARLAGDPTVEEVRDEQRLLKNLFAVTRVLRTGVQAVAIIMLVAAAGLIGNTVRMAVFARRKEIAIMKLVGATNWFIRIPFLIEGVVEGLLGAVMAVLAIFAMKVLFIDPLRGQVSFVPTWVGTGEILSTIPWIIGAGILIAAVASLVAMRRFLDV